MLTGALAALGCGAGTPRPTVGAIVATDVTGKALGSLAGVPAGQSVYFLVQVSNDGGLGADWQVTCSSAIPVTQLPPGTVDSSCGSFNPAHTLSGPVPSYIQTPAGVSMYVTQYTAPAQRPKSPMVLVTASATSLPSRNSSLTVPIN